MATVMTNLQISQDKVQLAMAAAEMESKDVSKESGVSVNIVYTIRRGFYTKPKYMDKFNGTCSP